MLVKIWDCGCGVEIELQRGGKISVIHSGGTPVEEILSGLRPYSDLQRVANAALRRWLRGYEGGVAAAQQNRLCVTVEHDGQSAEATP